MKLLSTPLVYNLRFIASKLHSSLLPFPYPSVWHLSNENTREGTVVPRREEKEQWRPLRLQAASILRRLRFMGQNTTTLSHTHRAGRPDLLLSQRCNRRSNISSLESLCLVARERLLRARLR